MVTLPTYQSGLLRGHPASWHLWKTQIRQHGPKLWQQWNGVEQQCYPVLCSPYPTCFLLLNYLGNLCLRLLNHKATSCPEFHTPITLSDV